MSDVQRPVTVLIAALGGEGGAVLANWIVSAAALDGWAAQSTSIPGVAQRTGATTYYIELFPFAGGEGYEGPQPVMALTPFPGNVDVVVASELVEVGRAIQNGYVTPDRTTLVGSTHRIYAMAEKTGMADGRFDTRNILRAAGETARRAVLFDMEAATAGAGSLISAVMLGAIAASRALPFPRSTYVEVIQNAGIAVQSNLLGFSAGCDGAEGAAELPELAADAAIKRPRTAPPEAEALVEDMRSVYPVATHAVLGEAIARLVDYQGAHYAELFLDRMDTVLDLDRSLGGGDRAYALTAQAARQTALRMSYEDMVRVADLKTRPERIRRVREEVRANPDEPVVITEFLKPGIEEFCSLLPGFLARPVMRRVRARGWEERFNVGLHVKTTTVFGYCMMRALAKLRRWRPRTLRYAEEQENLEHWLEALRKAAAIDYDFGLEVVELARLIKGYGGTRRRGLANYGRILEGVVLPAIESGASAAERTRKARAAALADPDGAALGAVLDTPAAAGEQSAPVPPPAESRSASTALH